MVEAKGLWDRLREEVKTASVRTRRGADRAIKVGVLKVDLVSLRRDRTRAHAHLGERALALWRADSLGSLDSDPEALRLRTLVQSIEDSIVAKETELSALKSAPSEPIANA